MGAFGGAWGTPLVCPWSVWGALGLPGAPFVAPLGGSLGGFGALGGSLSGLAWPAVHKGDTCAVIIGDFFFGGL